MSETKRKTRAPHGWRGYVAVLKYIQKQPRSSAEISERFGASRTAAQSLCRALVAAKLAHIGGWHKNPGERGQWVAMYLAGEGEEVAYPGRIRPQKPERRRNIKSSLLSLALILRTLEQPVSIKELVEFTGCSYGPLVELLKTLRELNMARVVDYMPRVGSAGRPERLFALGSAPDALPPPRMTAEELAKRRWKAKKARAEQQRLIKATAGNDETWSKAA